MQSMEIYSIPTGNFKLDGGAMFGVVPKSMWSKVYPADENNLLLLGHALPFGCGWRAKNINR